MAGYFVHLASAPNWLTKEVLGIKGLIAPDLWKKSVPTFDEYKEFFNGCEDSPTYTQVLLLCDESHGGTHFGSNPKETNCTDFKKVADVFEKGQMDITNPFFFGFVHHLRVDKLFYGDLLLCDRELYNRDIEKFGRQVARDMLHADWDKTNEVMRKWYPELNELIFKLPLNIQTIIKFVNEPTRFVNCENMHEFIEKMRTIETANELFILE